jgi:uncharacterized protein
VVALLDVSILIALFDAGHIHHQAAHDWFEDQRSSGWATCPLTENGFVRVATSPALFDPPKRPADVVEELRAFREAGHHHFWPDAISIADSNVFLPTLIRGHKQVSDAYLLGLATSRRGMFATLDQSIPLSAVKGATKANLVVVSAAPAESTPGDS